MGQLAILVCFFDLRKAYVPLSFFLLVSFLILYRSGLSGTILMFQPMAAHLEKQTDPEKEFRYERLHFHLGGCLVNCGASDFFVQPAAVLRQPLCNFEMNR